MEPLSLFERRLCWLSFFVEVDATYSMAGLLSLALSASQQCGAHATTSLRRPAAWPYYRVRAIRLIHGVLSTYLAAELAFSFACHAAAFDGWPLSE